MAVLRTRGGGNRKVAAERKTPHPLITVRCRDDAAREMLRVRAAAANMSLQEFCEERLGLPSAKKGNADEQRCGNVEGADQVGSATVGGEDSRLL